MVRILHLFPDMTFEERTKKTAENKVKIDKANDEVSFSEGISIFRERKISKLKFWRKRRNLGIYIDGASKLYSLDKKTKSFYSDFGSLEEIKKYIAREVAKAQGKQKPLQTWQFILIIALIAIVIILQLKESGVINV